MTALLHEALACYGLEEGVAVFLQHNENLTYRIGDYLLRIHRPAAGVYAPSTVEDRLGELSFLAHLNSQGMLVQRSVPNRQGDMVTILADGTAATLLTWLPGTDLSQAELTTDLCRQIGEMAARLHTAAQGFTHPGIRTYDAARCRYMEAQLLTMAQRHHLGESQADIFRAACSHVAHCFAHSADPAIVIHSDLSRSNILQTPDGLAPIDFSLFGLGSPMNDFGMLMAGINPSAARKAVLEGYQAAGGVYRSRECDAGFIHGLLGAFMFHADTWPLEGWFASRLDSWNREMLIPYCEGRALFDAEMNFTTM